MTQRAAFYIDGFSGKGVAHRPEPLRRGDGLAAVQLGRADVRRSDRPTAAAGEPKPPEVLVKTPSASTRNNLLLQEGPAFRYTTSEVTVQPSPCLSYRIPRDFVDLSTGEDAYKLIDFLKLVGTPQLCFQIISSVAKMN